MDIVVFIKQVPDTNDVKWTENNNIDRTRMESILNPVDREALEAAMILKDKYNARVYAVSMGPKKAKIVLSEAIAMGADEAYLLMSPKFSGSDTCATSRVLASFVKTKCPNANIIIFGQSAIDGETSQTGPSTAVRLNLPFMTHINNILKYEDNKIFVCSSTEKEDTQSSIELPAVLCINNFTQRPRIPLINGYIKAQSYVITTLNHDDLGLKEEDIGIKGSPTWVSKVYRTEEGRKCEFIEKNENTECFNTVVNLIKEASVANE